MSITAPHDSLFKFAFGDPVHAAAFLRSLLPPEIAALVAWESFAAERGSFVSPELQSASGDARVGVSGRSGGLPRGRLSPWCYGPARGNILRVPTVLRAGGFRFFFFSNEGNEPPHVHLERGEGHGKFWLDPVMLVYSTGLSATELRRAREIIGKHAEEMKERWNEHFTS